MDNRAKSIHDSLSDLPDELKVIILKFVLVEHEPVRAPVCHSAISPTFISVLLTCKALHGLAAEVYYGSNTFVIRWTCGDLLQLSSTSCDNKVGFRYPPYAYGHLVRTLRLEVEIGPALETVTKLYTANVYNRYGVPYVKDWCRLLRPRKVYSTRNANVPRPDWHDHFPRLEKVEFLVLKWSRFSWSRNHSPFAELCQKLSSHSMIHLQPRRVEIEFVSDLCCAVEQDYREIFSDMIRSMINLRED
ncbi:hypothetical protein ACN47E_008767 [Coniothyrium glycines]